MTNQRFVYLDHAASTAVHPQVVEAMLPYFNESYGNPHGLHQQGRASYKAMTAARREIAALLNCSPSEIIFTSGGSESDNMAVRGIAWAQRQAGKGQHIITSPIEHGAVSQTIAQLCAVHGFEQTQVPVDEYGRVSGAEVEAAIRPDTVLISIMAANNEVGTVQPVSELAELAQAHQIPFHTDAVQAMGVLDLDLKASQISALALSAHKFYGPKGVGVLYLRDGTPYVPHSTGGSHEENRRPGTENVPGIVGMATALKLAVEKRAEATAEQIRLRDRLINGILNGVEGAHLTGHPSERLPNHASFVFEGCEATALLMHLDMKKIGAASGSACATGMPEPSPVLLAMGLDPQLALGALRLTLGKQTTPEDIDYVVETLPNVVKTLRQLHSRRPSAGVKAVVE
jgi:cysteine desulfurase